MSRNFERVICKSVFAVGIAFASVFTAQAQVLGAPPEANQFEKSHADTSGVSSQILSAQSNYDPLQSKQAGPLVQKDNDDKIDALQVDDKQADDKQVVASVYHNGRVKKIKHENHDRRHHMRERNHRNERHHEEGGRHHRGRHHSS